MEIDWTLVFIMVGSNLFWYWIGYKNGLKWNKRGGTDAEMS